MKLDIIYNDDAIVVVNKSPNVLTIPDRYDMGLPNIRSILTNLYGKIYVVHRLDKETSGVLVFAKTEEAHKVLNDQFENGKTSKLYYAICASPIEQQGIINENIAPSKRKKGLFEVAKKGKSSLTEYKVIESYKRISLLQLKIHTGRTHQIRVHLNHMGSPLIVDSKYGLSDAFYLSEIKKYKRKKEVEERPLLSRSALHAYQLTINHPVTGAKKIFKANLPKDMKAVLYQLQKNLN